MTQQPWQPQGQGQAPGQGQPPQGWQQGNGQPPHGWQQGQGQPPQGWQSPQGQGQPPQGWQPAPQRPPSRGGVVVGWIVLAVVLAIAVLGAGSFLLVRALSPAETPAPPPASGSTPPPASSSAPVTTEEIGLDDVPAQVGEWVAQPVTDAMTGTYYMVEAKADDPSHLIIVATSFGAFDLGVMNLSNTVEFSDGRVVCGDAEFAFYDCYVDTVQFGSVYASSSGPDVPPEDVAAIANAIAAAHP